jgi:dienelactone hydrolase
LADAGLGRGRAGPSEREASRLDARDDGAAWAQLRMPALPSLADRPASRRWRDLLVDTDLAGIAPERARPTALVIGDRDGGDWAVPVEGLVGCGLAWHPRLPWVAGLARERGRAHPWVADYGTRTVRAFPHLRAATSLTELDRPDRRPLWWRDEGHLAFLAPPEPEPRGDASPSPPDEPLVFEAVGPAYVSFEPGLDELAAVAGAAIAELDVESGAVATLTDPLLVRRVEPLDDGSLVVQHATGVRAASRPGDGGMVWATGRVDPSIGPAPLEPLRPADRPGAPARPRRRRLRAATGAPTAVEHGHEVARGRRVSSEPLMFTPPGAEHEARLAVFPAPRDARGHADVLWVRATSRPPRPGAVDEPTALAGCGGAVLDLPLCWPGDVTVERLHEQVVQAVATSVDLLARRAEQASNRADRRRVVVGGHSFGATLALYALVHVPGLAAGIAHSGCYNRTLTPYGFQYERRRYWEAPEVYAVFSALLFAHRIRRPVLLVHGLDDVNPATHPDQAVELYRALVATSGHARLVLLPGEGHNFRYRETHRHLARVHRDWVHRVSA